jgi:hypothetical protein
MIFVYLNLTLFIQGYILISIREKRNEMIEITIRYLYMWNYSFINPITQSYSSVTEWI